MTRTAGPGHDEAPDPVEQAPETGPPGDVGLLARLQDVTAMARHGVPGCDEAAVTVTLSAGTVTAAATSDAARAIDAAQYATDDGPCLRALREGVVVRVDDHATDGRWPSVGRTALEAGMSSSLSLPLQSGGRLVGALNLHGRRARAFDEWSAQVGGVLARQAAGAISDAEALRVRGVAHSAEQRIAQTLQRELLPVVPALPGILSAARYVPAQPGAQVGGDWYDVFALPDAAIGVAVGDVMGHDIAAAASMGQLRSVLRSYAYEGGDPCGVLDRLDRLAQGFDMPLATAVYGRLELQAAGGRLSFCNAGHVPPLVRLPDGRTRRLEDGTSWLIGVPASRLGPRSQAVVRLPSGATLVLYTDGLVERHRRHLDDGIDELCRALSGPLPDTAPDALCDRVLEAMAGDGYVDDLALLVLQLE